MSESLETQFGRLDERLKSLEQKQDDHHKTVLAEIQDLKNGIVVRLERVEITRLLADDFIRFKKDEFAPLSQDVKTLLAYRYYLAGGIALAIFLAPIIWEVVHDLIKTI